MIMSEAQSIPLERVRLRSIVTGIAASGLTWPDPMSMFM